MTLALVVTELRPPHTRIEHRIDLLGTALLTVVATAAILISVWGGTRYAWGSAQILTLAAVAVVGVVATVVVERRATEPMPAGTGRSRSSVDQPVPPTGSVAVDQR